MGQHKNINKKYYSKGELTFKTFAGDKRLAIAMAEDFIERANRVVWDDEITIVEFGPGRGEFARLFLDWVEKLNPEIYNRVEYYLIDFSERLLTQSIRVLHNHKSKIHTIQSDVTEEYPELPPINYARFNEFWDDLPAKIFTLKDNELYEVQTRKRFITTGDHLYEACKGFLEENPFGYHLMVNDYAIEHMINTLTNLTEYGYMDGFDYGFRGMFDITLPPDTFNSGLRRISDHITYDVNFDLMLTVAKVVGAKGYVETQDDYVQTHFNERLYAVELSEGLRYLTKEEMNTRFKEELLRMGYSVEFLSGRFVEGNDYYHIRLWVDSNTLNQKQAKIKLVNSLL